MDSIGANTGLAVRMLDDIEKFAGRFPSYRRAHARGRCYAGVFTPNGNAAPFTSAPHLQMEKVPVIVRFSNVSSNPNHSDGLTPPKGMAVQFSLPNDKVTSLVCTTIPVFFARTPEAFGEIMQFLASVRTGLPRIRSAINIIRKYPETRSFLKVIRETRLPASYAMAQYYSIHAFYFINKEGHRQAIKYQWEPDAGISMFTKKESALLLPNYLDEELAKRVINEPIGFKLNIQIGQEDDPVDDPTILWPYSRQKLTIGHLTITDALDSSADQTLFDPTIMPEGIECTEDPILQFRHEAYKISYKRRMDY
ncbi:catalase family peroxidase [Peribacillus sp. SCS-155]|uniref:catalase family peroxidase n=1 Tax=Peribacillus sedimenti TaxID=3115297 RepID=UPI003905D678